MRSAANADLNTPPMGPRGRRSQRPQTRLSPARPTPTGPRQVHERAEVQPKFAYSRSGRPDLLQKRSSDYTPSICRSRPANARRVRPSRECAPPRRPGAASSAPEAGVPRACAAPGRLASGTGSASGPPINRRSKRFDHHLGRRHVVRNQRLRRFRQRRHPRHIAVVDDDDVRCML